MTARMSLLARTIARDRSVGVDVLVELPGVTVPCRGTYRPRAEKEIVGSADLAVRDAMVRIPKVSLPSEPPVGTPIVVAGEALYVAEVLSQDVTYEIQLTEWDPINARD